MRSFVGSIFATLYFIFPMSIILLLLIFMPIGFLTDVSAIRTSGFAGSNSAASLIGVLSLFIGLSMLIPPLRKMYRALPWLYAFVRVFFLNLIILNVGLWILNYGYQVNNEARHTTFFVLMITQLVVCRLGMCAFFKLKPATLKEAR